MTATDCKILSARFVPDLESDIREHLRAGWHLVGGLAAMHDRMYALIIKPASPKP